jgi:hypothetical protein
MRKERSVVLYNELKNNWQRELHINVSTYERRGMGWWKMGIW